MKNKQIAIITGASSGFGKDFARYIDKFYNLDEIWLIARNEDKLNITAKNLHKAKPVIIPLDLTEKDSFAFFQRKLKSEMPIIKILVNNAGFGIQGEFAENNLKTVNNMIDLNIKAVVSLAHISLNYMTKDCGIINTASAAAFAPLPYFNVYGATKSFVLYFSHSLFEELKEKNITVTAVCPGPAATNFFEAMGSKSKHKFRIASSKSIVKRALKDFKNKKSVSVEGYDIIILRFFSKLIPDFILAKIGKLIKKL